MGCVRRAVRAWSWWHGFENFERSVSTHYVYTINYMYKLTIILIMNARLASVPECRECLGHHPFSSFTQLLLVL